MADQSYGGALVAEAEARFTSLLNVIIFTSADEFNWNTKDRLTKSLLRSQHNDICLNDFKNVSGSTKLCNISTFHMIIPRKLLEDLSSLNFVLLRIYAY